MTPRNYGDHAAEYEAARERAGMLTRTDRSFLRVYGRDPMRIIQGIVTNDVTNAPADRVIYGAFLTPKGRMIADVRVIRTAAQEMLLDVPATAVTALLEMFKRTVAPLFARFEDVTEQYSLIGVYGPASPRIAADVLGEMPALQEQDGYASQDNDGVTIRVMTTREAGGTGFEMLVSAQDADTIENAVIAAGATRIGDATLDVMRIEAGTPRWGYELDETTIPLEAGLLQRAIATNKGCYTGQEVIVRIMHRGHVNWRLCGFLMDDLPTPPRGETLTLPGQAKNIARITSAAFSPQLGQTIALGYLRREIETPADLCLADGTHASAVTLPFDAVPMTREKT